MPTLDKLAKLPGALGVPDTLLADSGYFSAANVEACAAANIQPMIAVAGLTPQRVTASPLWKLTTVLQMS